MGLFAGDNQNQGDEKPVDQRAAGGPPEGQPGETITIMMTDVMPPVVIMAVVQPDGYFSQDIYDKIAAARARRTEQPR